MYEELIKAGQDRGEFSKKYDSQMIARSIVSFIDGLALDHAILPEEEIQLKEQSLLFVEYLKMALGIEKNQLTEKINFKRIAGFVILFFVVENLDIKGFMRCLRP